MYANEESFFHSASAHKLFVKVLFRHYTKFCSGSVHELRDGGVQHEPLAGAVSPTPRSTSRLLPAQPGALSLQVASYQKMPLAAWPKNAAAKIVNAAANS